MDLSIRLLDEVVSHQGLLRVKTADWEYPALAAEREHRVVKVWYENHLSDKPYSNYQFEHYDSTWDMKGCAFFAGCGDRFAGQKFPLTGTVRGCNHTLQSLTAYLRQQLNETGYSLTLCLSKKTFRMPDDVGENLETTLSSSGLSYEVV
jgi:hypothetical protein